jgi:hypothetical protein
MMLVVGDGDLVRVPKNLDREILVHIRYRFGMTVVGGTRKLGSLLQGFATAGDWGRDLPAGPSAKQEGNDVSIEANGLCRLPISTVSDCRHREFFDAERHRRT